MRVCGFDEEVERVFGGLGVVVEDGVAEGGEGRVLVQPLPRLLLLGQVRGHLEGPERPPQPPHEVVVVLQIREGVWVPQ